MTGDERELVKAQERVEKGAAGITAEYRKLAKESLETQRYAKKAWEESLPPLQRYENAMEKLNRAYQGTARESDEYKAAVKKLEAQHLSLGTSGAKGVASIGKELSGVLTTVGGISGAVALINTSYEAWVENTNEIADATRSAMKEVKAFAAMQEPGTEKQRAIEVANRYAGIMSAGESWDTVQALMSASNAPTTEGKYREALQSTDVIVQAMKMQVEKADALETARQAVVQGQNVGEYMRAVAASGEFGIRDAPTMAKASRALQNWTENPTFGWAAAATVGGAKGDQVESYLKQAGVALSGVSKAEKWFESRGVGRDATQEQRLAELVESSKDTVEELTDIGLVDAEARDAVLALVKNYPTVMEHYGLLRGAMADPNFMLERIAKVEAGIPEVALAERTEAARGRFKAARMFGREQSEHQLWASILAEELQKEGVNQVFGARMFDDDGKLNEGGYATFMRRWMPDPSQSRVRAYQQAEERMLQELNEINRNTVRRPDRAVVPTPEQ